MEGDFFLFQADAFCKTCHEIKMVKRDMDQKLRNLKAEEAALKASRDVRLVQIQEEVRYSSELLSKLEREQLLDLEVVKQEIELARQKQEFELQHALRDTAAVDEAQRKAEAEQLELQRRIAHLEKEGERKRLENDELLKGNFVSLPLFTTNESFFFQLRDSNERSSS